MAKDIDDDGPLDLDAMQVLTEAIAGTEKEIFSEATGGTGELLDETGDRSLEQMGDGLAGEHEPDEEDEPEVDATIDAKDGKEQPRADDGKFTEKTPVADDKHPVPRGVLQEERDKRQATEQLLAAEREQRANDRKEFDARMAALEAKVTAPKQEPVAQPAVEQPKNDAPDMFLDPVGYQKYVTDQIVSARLTAQREMQLRFASIKHGETYNKAYAAFNALPATEQNQVGPAIAKTPDVGEALVNWYRQQETLKRVGADPDAYETRVKAETREALMKDPEFRKQLLADMQAEASTGLNGRPRTVVNIPSLNGASGSNSARLADPELYNGSEKSVFQFATG